MSGVEAVAWAEPLVLKKDYDTLRAQLEAAEARHAATERDACQQAERASDYRDRLLVALERAATAEARAEAAEAECARIGVHAEIGRAVERACKELPEGAEVSIFLEKESGWVEVTDWDGNQIDVQPRDTFAETINAAIDLARTKEQQA